MLRVPRRVGQVGKSVFRSLFGARSVRGMRRGFKIDVVEAAQNLARCFPELRPRGEEVIAFAEEIAAMLGEDDFHVPPDLLAEGLARVELAERRRLVEHFAADQPTGWRRLVQTYARTRSPRSVLSFAGRSSGLSANAEIGLDLFSPPLKEATRCRGHRARSSLSSSNRLISARSSRRQMCPPKSPHS